MITLHKLGGRERFLLNPDLIVTIQATPDTVIALASNVKVVVAESPTEISALISAWRAHVLREAISPAGTAPGIPAAPPGGVSLERLSAGGELLASGEAADLSAPPALIAR